MNLRSFSFVLLVLAVTMVAFAPAPVAAATCESLKSLSLENATITSAQAVAAGQFSLPEAGRGAAQENAVFPQLPTFCRVVATLRPSSDSDIKIEVWLPMGNCHGKHQAVANAAPARVITYSPTPA